MTISQKLRNRVFTLVSEIMVDLGFKLEDPYDHRLMDIVVQSCLAIATVYRPAPTDEDDSDVMLIDDVDGPFADPTARAAVVARNSATAADLSEFARLVDAEGPPEPPASGSCGKGPSCTGWPS